MKHVINYILFIVFSFSWMACSRDAGEELSSVEPVPGWEEGMVGFGAESRSGAIYSEEDFLHNTFIHNESYLRIYNYVGQVLDFTDDADYKWYVYDENLSTLTGGQYNFRPLEGRGFLWSELKIESTGYRFDAAVFPRFHKYRNEVYDNQSTFDNFLASDILMAHHVQAATDFGKRVAFKFYHVLTMLNVTIYVPKYDPKTNTGFERNALSDVVLPELYTKFKFNPSAAITSDAAPSVTTHTVTNFPDDCPKKDIRMYPRYDVKDFSDVKVEKDAKGRDCYVYNLVAILPMQTISEEEVLLRLTLKTKDGLEKKFQYIPGKSDKPISFKSGSITEVKLTLSEEGNKAFLISAKVMPWEQASADMSLEKEKNK